MQIKFKLNLSKINIWQVIRLLYRFSLICGFLAVISVFIFLYVYFYQPITEARITVNLTYDTIYQKVNKSLFDKITKNLDERKQEKIDLSEITNPF